MTESATLLTSRADVFLKRNNSEVEKLDNAQSDNRLDKLAAEAAKTVGEFNALLADVENRTRNQRVLLERYYDKGILKPDDCPLSPSSSCSSDSGPKSVARLQVDELANFGPLTKKLKENPVLNDPRITHRRFSDFSTVIAKSPYVRFKSGSTASPILVPLIPKTKTCEKVTSSKVDSPVQMFADASLPPQSASPQAQIQAAASRLLVRDGEHAVIYEGTPPTSTPGSPRRLMSPDFSNAFSFSRKDKVKPKAKLDGNLVKDSSSSGQLERLLAGLNFSKFRLAADRLGMSSLSLDRNRSPSPRSTGALRSQQPASTAVSGASDLGQQNPAISVKSTPGSESECMRSQMSRTISQPSGLTATSFSITPWINRIRVTHSEDREITRGNYIVTHRQLNNDGASCHKASADISTLTTDIRQHFRLNLHESEKGEIQRQSTPVDPLSDSTLVSPCFSRKDAAKCRRDSDYVVSMVSDDCSESTGLADEMCEMDTESTSSSFIFSPAASSVPSTNDRKTQPAKSLSPEKSSSDSSVKSSVPFKLTSSGRSLTFPPQTRKNSTGCVNTVELLTDVKIIPQSASWSSCPQDARLSSTSIPESAMSLTDSMYSTAGSSSIYSFPDTTLGNSSGAESPKSVRIGHDDNSPETSPPLHLKELLIRESGSVAAILLHEDNKPTPDSDASYQRTTNKQHKQLASEGPLDDNHNAIVAPSLQTLPQSQSMTSFSDSFRRADRRVPRGPFGVRLEEDRIRRDRKPQQHLDLSFLHEPTTPLSSIESPSELGVPDTRMSKGRRSSAVAVLTRDDVAARTIANVQSTPDLFQKVNPKEVAVKLRIGEICRSVSDVEQGNWKKEDEETDSAVYSCSTDSVPSDSPLTRVRSQGAVLRRNADFRIHIVKELVDTESSYVESLQILHKYYDKVKNNEEIVDRTQAESIFYQIPDIKNHHETLLTALKKRMESWDHKQKIGDIIVSTFTKDPVVETYSAFINNWKTAKEAIRMSKTSRPSFAKFLEQCAREHPGKLNFDALFIMPVQRIPRYELLIKELLKHTAEDHPDRMDLMLARSEIHDLALKINAVEHEVDQAEKTMIRLKELELYIDGLSDLVDTNRKFLKFDTVTMASGMGLKKDRCLFLFTDILVITSLKRKSGAIRKPSTNSCSPQLYPTLENNRYKLLMKISLDDLELANATVLNSRKSVPERDLLESDLTVLNKIRELSNNLSSSHQPLDDAVRSMFTVVSRHLSEQERSFNSHDAALSKIELIVATQNGTEALTINFLSTNKRSSWEKAFLDAKENIGLHSNRPAPEFVKAIPIQKTRAGLQLSCAAPTSDLNGQNLRDVWISNSDGYIGQICVLSLQPDPAITSCVAVSNSRITCIASIPGNILAVHNDSSATLSRSISPISDHSSSGELHHSASLDLELDSGESSDDEEASNDEHSRSLPSEKESFSIMSEDEMSTRSHNGPDPAAGTMWIGMENGCVFVCHCSDNIRIKKPRMKLHHSAAVQSISYTDQMVFVGLSNGQLAVYNRPVHGLWETTSITIQLPAQSAAITQTVVACSKLWCACLNSVYLVNTTSLQVESSFPVGTDVSRPISFLVCHGLGVWISNQNSAVLRLYNALSCEAIGEINLAPSVQKMLAGGDDIVRQHKLACLRITALLSCKDLLWIGTSAGVILTINIPHITQGTTKLSCLPTVTGLWYGHTGQVRFLQCVEQENQIFPPTSQNSSHRRSFRRGRRHSTVLTTSNRTLVISGGDGYEDLRCSAPVALNNGNNNTDSVTGRDDSTNHLILWHC